MSLKFTFNPLTGKFDYIQGVAPLDVESIQFDAAYVTTEAEPIARIFWDTANHCLTVVGENGTRLQIGQEGVFWGVNKTGSTIPNGTPVYISGVQGQRPTIAPCKGDAEATAFCVGVTTQEFLNNAEGYVTYDGLVHDMTTLASFADGDGIWVSKATAGALVNAEPAKPHHSDKIGVVLSNHAVHGILLVKIFRHLSLRELSDVDGAAPTTTGDLVTWNNSSAYWETGTYNVLNLSQYVRTAPTTAAQNTIQPSADVVNLTIKQKSGGTANLTEWKDSAGNTWAYVAKASNFYIKSPSKTQEALTITTSIDFVSGQYGDQNPITKWTTTSGTVLAKMTAARNASGNGDYDIALFDAGGFRAIPSSPTVGAGVQVWKNSTPTSAIFFGNNVAGQTPTDDLYFSTYLSGWGENFHSSNIGNTTGEHLNIPIYSASRKGLVIKAASAQVANLTEWQNSSGTVLSKVEAGGNIVSNTIFHPFLLMGG